MKTKRPLEGKTILVTRPRAQAADLCRRLSRHGARVIPAPAIRIAPPSSWKRLDEALLDLGRYDTLIFTSANGVDQFFKRSRRVLGTKMRSPRRLYAIGPGTAKALARRGWRAAHVPETYEAGALARFLPQARGLNILIPRARVARDILPKTLCARGARVDVVEAYRTIPDRSGTALIRRTIRSAPDFVTFTSASTVEHFVSAAGTRNARKLFKKTIAASIGPITSAALRRRGIGNILEARTYTVDGIIRALINYASKTRA